MESNTNAGQRNWFALPLQVIFNFTLALMLWGTIGALFFVPYESVKDKVITVSSMATLALAASLASGGLYLYRRRRGVSFLNIVKTPPVKIWGVVFSGLALLFSGYMFLIQSQ